MTKTITTEQVYKEWDGWKLAMMSEYTSIVEEKKAVRQVKRCEAQRMATESNIKYEELPSKVVFTRKMGGKRKVRACICGNYENEVATAMLEVVTHHRSDASFVMQHWKNGPCTGLTSNVPF